MAGKQGFYYGGYPWREWGILTAKDLNDAISVSSNAGPPEAPMDGQVYARYNGVWIPIAATQNVGRADPIIVNSTASVSPTQDGSVYVYNTTGAEIHIGLADGVILDQILYVKDAGGNAGTYPLTLDCASSIDGNATYQIVYNYGSLNLRWLGNMWGT